jgi:nicotinamidase-related amidase
MNKSTQIQSSLAKVEDSILILIDIQDYFLKKYSEVVSKVVMEKAVWLINLAQHLNVPIVAMAEDIENSGSLSKTILEALPKGVKVHNKNVFGLGGHPEILQDIEVTGRKTAVLIGMETDVCVAHSAFHLIDRGYKVVVLKDAVATTSDSDGEVGLGRMRDAGAAISSAKGIYYEWLRSVQNLESLLEKTPEIKKFSPMEL